MNRVSALGYGLALLYAIPNLLMPIDGNTSIFYYVGSGWLQGYWPYESAVDHKPPGLYMLYALAALVFDQQGYGIRLLELAAVLATGSLLGRIFERADPPAPGLGGIAALLVASFYYTSFDYFATGEAELWEALFIVAAWCTAGAGTSSGARSLCVGSLGGVATMFKLPAVIPFVGVAGLLIVRCDDVRSSFRFAFTMIVGFVATVVSMFMPFLLTGRSADLWEVVVQFNLFYATVTKLPQQSPLAWFWLEHALPSTLILAATLFAAAVRTLWFGDCVRLRLGIEIVVLGALALLSVVVQDKYLHYHWAVVAPFIAAGILWGIAWVSDKPRVTALLASICVAATLLLTPPSSDRHPPKPMRPYRDLMATIWSNLACSASREQHLTPYRSHYYSYIAVDRLSEVVNEYKGPGDTLCTLDTFVPLAYTATRLRCPSRFFADHVLSYIKREPEKAGELKGWLAEHDAVLLASPPTFLIVSKRFEVVYWGRPYRILAGQGRHALLRRSD